MNETGQVRHDVRSAAARLGISPDGVRKQIRRGKLSAEKIGAQWFVLLPQDSPETGHRPETGRSNLGTRLVEAGPPAYDESRRYLQELRDEWLMPLIQENGKLRERLGRLEERLALAEHERDEARARLKPIVLSSPPLTNETLDSSPAATSPQWWAFWRR